MYPWWVVHFFFWAWKTEQVYNARKICHGICKSNISDNYRDLKVGHFSMPRGAPLHVDPWTLQGGTLPWRKNQTNPWNSWIPLKRNIQPSYCLSVRNKYWFTSIHCQRKLTTWGGGGGLTKLSYTLCIGCIIHKKLQFSFYYFNKMNWNQIINNLPVYNVYFYWYFMNTQNCYWNVASIGLLVFYYML